MRCSTDKDARLRFTTRKNEVPYVTISHVNSSITRDHPGSLWTYMLATVAPAPSQYHERYRLPYPAARMEDLIARSELSGPGGRLIWPAVPAISPFRCTSKLSTTNSSKLTPSSFVCQRAGRVAATGS